MGRLPKQIHFQRVQVYLLPEEVMRLKVEAQNENVNLSRYLRNVIITTFTSKQRNIL